MNRLRLPNQILTLALLFLLAGGTAAAQSAAPETANRNLARWTENFSAASALTDRWVAYGGLADGQWAQGPKARPEWWQVVDGALCGRNFPEEKHPAAISRAEQLASSLSETGVRVSWRVKIEAGSKGTLRLFGKSAGQFSAEATDNHVTDAGSLRHRAAPLEWQPSPGDRRA